MGGARLFSIAFEHANSLRDVHVHVPLIDVMSYQHTSSDISLSSLYQEAFLPGSASLAAIS